ncbi:MAG: HD domain-containing protein [Myxococcota bacterium]
MSDLYGPRVGEALKLAADAFAPIGRKGSGVPYLTHLLAVAATVGENGGDEEQIIAAVLHDYLEDIDGADAADLEARFGPRVRRLVEDLSDAITRPKPPWRARKEAYIASLRGKPAELKLISAADKLHNAESILRDHEVVGAAIWDRFTATREESLWYYRSIAGALGDGWQHPLLERLRRTVDRLHTI